MTLSDDQREQLEALRDRLFGSAHEPEPEPAEPGPPGNHVPREGANPAIPANPDPQRQLAGRLFGWDENYLSMNAPTD
jgi:hypothetical protein